MERFGEERGIVVIAVALLLVVMVGFAALATDMGFLYSSRTGGQAIVDASALAGAATFIYSPNANQPATADQQARATALAQSVLTDPVLAGELTVAVDVPNQLVTVTMDRNEETFFGRALGTDQAQIVVSGTAEAAVNASGSGCTKPWFIPNSVLLPTDGSIPIPGFPAGCDGLTGQDRPNCYASAMCSACTTPIDPLTSQLLAYRIGNTDVFAVPVPTQTLLATNPPLINVRPTRPSDSLSPGQFYSIRLGDSTGGNDYRTNIATCSGEQTFCGSCYVTEPGNMIGPTRQGVDDLIPDPPDNFFVLADGRWCFGASSTDCETTGSPQLVIAPIWDICNTPGVGACPAEDFCADADSDGFPDGKFSGTPSLRIIAYATLFVTGWSGTDLQALLLDVKPCVGGPATDDDGNLQTGPLATPLRLVKAP